MPTEHSRCPKSRLFSRSERVPSLGGSPVWLRRTTTSYYPLPPSISNTVGNISSNNKNNSNRFDIAYSVDKANNVRSTCTLFLPTALGTPPPSYLSLIKSPNAGKSLQDFMDSCIISIHLLNIPACTGVK